MGSIWDVDGIEWEDIPTLGDLVSTADKKTLVREIAHHCYADAQKGEKDWKHSEKKRAKKKYKRIMELARDVEPSDTCVLFPRHIVQIGFCGKPARYDLKPVVMWKQKVMQVAQEEKRGDFFEKGAPIGRGAKRALGYRVWFGGLWGQHEMYRFLAARCCEILSSIDWADDLEEHLANGGMTEDEWDSRPYRHLRNDVLYPMEVFNAKAFGLDPGDAGLEIPDTPYQEGQWETERRLDDMVDAVFKEELANNIIELGKKLERGYEPKRQECEDN